MTMYEWSRTLSGRSAWRVWKGASARGDLWLGMSWSVNSGVAMIEVMRMERQKEDNTAVTQATVCTRNTVPLRPMRR
jgi:hypothetical protein